MIKCTTEHLLCTIEQNDDTMSVYYCIWDLNDSKKPLLIYVNAHTIHIAVEIDDITEHPYFGEICGIVQDLAEEEYERNKKGGII